MNLWNFLLTQCKSYINGLFVCEAVRSNYFPKIDNPAEKMLVNNLALILIMLSSGERFVCLVHLEQDQNLRKLLKCVLIWVPSTQGIYNLFQLQTPGIVGISIAYGKNLCSLLKSFQYWKLHSGSKNVTEVFTLPLGHLKLCFNCLMLQSSLNPLCCSKILNLEF